MADRQALAGALWTALAVFIRVAGFLVLAVLGGWLLGWWALDGRTPDAPGMWFAAAVVCLGAGRC